MKIYLSKQTFDGRDYYYFVFGSDVIYVSSDLVLFDASPYIEFPLRGVDIVSGDKVKIIKRGLKNLFLLVFYSAGGRSLVEFVDEDEVEIVSKAFYTTEEDYLKNEYLILTTSTNTKIFWNGYCSYNGNPSKGVSIYHLDGAIETLPYVSKSDFPLLFENV